jgi:hypothetical protein
MRTLGIPVKSSGELLAIRSPAPLLGQHSAEVLRKAGYGDGDIDALFSGGVIHEQYREKSRDEGGRMKDEGERMKA